MGILKSALFAGDPRLEACAVSDPAHVVPGSKGAHVGKIHIALITAGFGIAPNEVAAKYYGQSTAKAVLAFKKARNILNYMGQLDNIVGKKTIRALDEVMLAAQTTPPEPVKPPAGEPPKPPSIEPPKPQQLGPPEYFIVHDVRLFGWRPTGDNWHVLEVNGDTPLQWVIDSTIKRGKDVNGNLVLKIQSHGLPGFVQCARGALEHPTLPEKITDPAKGGMYIGPGKSGISAADINQLAQLKGFVRRIEFHCCLVARIGPCWEANGHTSYDGNSFCYRLAQATGAEVKASIHLQWYWLGSGPHNGMHFGHWNGTVFTWGPAGNIIAMEQYPYKDYDGPPPPGTQPT